MMRHLHFVQSVEILQGGGLGEAALRLHEEIRQKEKSFLIATKGSKAPTNIEDSRIYDRAFYDKFYYSPAMTGEAGNFVADADIVHGHGFYVYPNALYGGLARKMDKPLIYHPQGMLSPWALSRSAWKKHIVRFLYENKNFQHAKLWHALTEEEANQIRNQGVKGEIVIAPNGVSLENFDNGNGDSPVKKKYDHRLLFLGRIHPKKGLDLLINAWQSLSGVRKNWELVIAGPIDNYCISEINRILKPARNDPTIIFCDSVERNDKIALLKSADAFVLPSYSEGFSISILEAMACRLPILATYECFFPEIENQNAGWLCTANVNALKSSLEQLFKCSEDDRKLMGQVGRRMVKDKYQWKSIAETIMDACKSVI